MSDTPRYFSKPSPLMRTSVGACFTPNFSTSSFSSFAFSAVFLKRLFTLSPLDFPGMLLLAVFALLAWPALNLAYQLREKIEKRKPRDKT